MTCFSLPPHWPPFLCPSSGPSVLGIPRTQCLESSFMYNRSLNTSLSPVALGTSYVLLTPEFLSPVLTSPELQAGISSCPLSFFFTQTSSGTFTSNMSKIKLLNSLPNLVSHCFPISVNARRPISSTNGKPEPSCFLLFLSSLDLIHKQRLQIDPKCNHV